MKFIFVHIHICNYLQNTYLQFSKSKEALLFKFAYISIMRNSTRNKEKCLFVYNASLYYSRSENS